jgi:outer membrane cobalamin receptor
VYSEITWNRVLLKGITIFSIVFFLSLPSKGQSVPENDTLKISEVIIRRNIFDQDPSGYKRTTIDSSVMINYNTRNLSDLLSYNTGIFIKSYGMGGIATPSFRGTGASHTVIDWNGISINNPMLGQSDLAIIPVGLIDDIQICYGGASMSLNNGGIGGTINLETKPVWNKETSVILNTGAGSFRHYSGFIKVKAGNYRLQSVTKGFYQQAENNFRFLNDQIGAEPVWQTRTNSQTNQHGFIQELFFHCKESIVSARVWYQSSDRNLPGSLLTLQTNSKEKQFDESLRTMMNYNLSKGSSNLSLSGAWMMSRSDYSNILASIDSRNRAEVLTLKAAFENSVTMYTKLKIVFDEQSDVIKSNNYDHKTSRNTANITASLEKNKKRFGSTILIREILDNSTFLIPDFSVAAQYRLLTSKEYYIKTSFTRNSKLPGMNDMYWVPGGNPDLKNEYALMYEISYDMVQKLTENLNLKYNISAFRYNIRDMIQWHQGEYSYWTADNIKSVKSTGLETSASIIYRMDKLKTSLNTCYTFTKAVAGGPATENYSATGKQLMYVPQNQANASLFIDYGSLYSTFTSNFSGKRYITVDNIKYLSPYMIYNLSAGIKVPVKESSVDMNFSIDNLFDINYQSIAYYPLPGRSYFIKILVKLIK